ncbi:MAG TPA: alpha-amylase family protein, partial [Chloroflexota bacterium]|nr:alpha-amylase family protein [Chloroflexota bacterium]
PRDVMAELHAECQRAGIRIMAYFSVCFDNYALGLYPEWRVTDRAGNAPKIGSFFTACPNSAYRAFAAQQLEELVAHAPWDGVWLDIIPLAWGTTPLWLIHAQNVPCYCLGCQRAFLQRTGKMLPLNPTPLELRENFEFMTASTSALLDDLYAVIHHALPDALVTYNAAGAPGDPIDSADLVSIEGHAPNYARQSFLSRWGRACAKPFEIMTAGAVTGWNGWDVKPAATIELEMAIATVQGGSMTVGLAPYPNGALEAGWFDSYVPAYRAIERLEPLTRGATGVYDVGVALPVKPRTAPEAWSPMYQAAEAMHELLLQEHLPHAVLPKIEDLARYQLVVLANQLALSDAEAQALRSYVADGGTLLVTGETGLFDDEGRQRGDFALADVLGVHFLHRTQMHRVYVHLADPSLAADIPSMPLAFDQQPAAVRIQDSQVLATFTPGEAEMTDATTVLWGHPAPAAAPALPLAIVNHYGRGRSLYLALNLVTQGFVSLWPRMLVRNALRWSVPEPSVSVSAPPFVEVVVNRQGSQHILHLLNYSAGAADSTPALAPVQGITVRANLARIGNLTRVSVAGSNDAVPVRLEGGWLYVEVPPLVTQLALILE